MVFVGLTDAGWTSISGSLLVSDTVDGGPGLSAQYVHVRALLKYIESLTSVRVCLLLLPSSAVLVHFLWASH